MFLQALHDSCMFLLGGMPGADHELTRKAAHPCFQMYVVSAQQQKLYHIVAERPDATFSLRSTSFTSHNNTDNLKSTIIYFEYKYFYIFKLYALRSSACEPQTTRKTAYSH